MTDSGDEVVVLSGASPRHGDPWHPFEVTSGAIARALSDRELSPRVETDIDRVLAEWSGPGARHPSLVVVNIGWYGAVESLEHDAIRGLEALLSAGVPMLFVHSSLTAFPVWPRWEQIMGGRWVYDRTYHSDRGPGRALIAPGHPLARGLRDFDIVDERYTRLRVSPAADVFLEHEEEGERHPLAWTHRVEESRVVSDALGHDLEGYGSARLALLDREIDWLRQR